MWNARNPGALLRLYAGYFWAHSCYCANRFYNLRRTWLKRHWLLRKRQSMRDGKCVRGRQGFLSFLLFFSRRERPLLPGKFYQRYTKFYPTCSTVASLDFPGKFLPQPVDFASCRGLTGSWSTPRLIWYSHSLNNTQTKKLRIIIL